MMTDWIIHYVMLAAYILGNFVALPVFLAASIVMYRRIPSKASVSLIVAVGLATFARFIRQTPLAREYSTYTLPNGGTGTAFGPNAFGIFMEILFRADIFAIAIIVLCMAIAWGRRQQGDAQRQPGPYC